MEHDPGIIFRELGKVLNTDGAYERWLAFTVKEINFYLSGKPGNTYYPSDILKQAIDKLIDGKRKWDLERFPRFFNFVFLVIRSEIRNLAAKKEELVYDYYEREVEDVSEETEKYTPLVKKRNLQLTDDPRDKHELVDLCFDLLEKDPLLQNVFLDWYEGLKNRQIALKRNIQTKEVVNIKKRIQRILVPAIEIELKKKGRKLYKAKYK